MSAIDFPLHFLRPWWWLALLPLPFALLALARGGGGRAALARLADAALLPHLIDDVGTRRRLALALTAFAWVLAVAALAGPAWQRVKTPLYVNGAVRVVALSLSNDMLAQDLKPDRLTRAKFAVRDLLDASGDARTALVAYAGAAFTVAPLTDDKRTVLNLLRVLQPNVMPVQGNDAAAAIGESVALLRQAHVEGGEIVLVTNTVDDAAVRAAHAAREQGIRVDVLGVGSDTGAPVPRPGGGFVHDAGNLYLARRNDAALREVANTGGGRYAVLQPDGSGVAALGAPVAFAGHASAGERAEVWRDGGVWLLPILLVLGALAFRRGWLLAFALLATPIAMPNAHASTWDAWWSNRNQRALQALQRGDMQRARELAHDPAIEGAADYRAGDYKAAAKAFASHYGAQARYNLGNALAKAGEYQKALAAYDEALKRDPGMADARANRKAVEDWLRRHQPPPQNGQSRQQGGQGSNGSQQNNTARPGSQSQGQQAGNSPQQPSQQNGQSGARTAQGQSGEENGAKNAGHDGNDGASAREDAAQRKQARQAAEALRQELAKRDGKDGRHASAFALGHGQTEHDDKLSAEQRAMLDSVPDDPGALLRRKFRLEWQRRHGTAQGNDQ